ncbi:thioredoxin family protein [Brevibacillus ruminantium]|uniref:Thioredoxin family protein n=1 Tax=Brevibacillus ruminantium TaxID=2950604 RepID=A0ABY4WDI6_9BACL|nr:thioredoxin family protein [Brevibacillus ruminantium]USG64906.1 thioredoxin family protein [Brevibacillus ruminantium]
MNICENLEEVQALIRAKGIVLVFIKTSQCGVCDAVLAKTEELLSRYPEVAGCLVSMEKTPVIASEFLVFTAPTLLLFADGREVHRQSRFVEFAKWEKLLHAWTDSLA